MKKPVHKKDIFENDKVITDLRNQLTDLNNKYLRALADYQNLERRTREQADLIRNTAGETLIKKILPALDTFDQAQKHLKDDGLELAINKFNQILEKEGVKKFVPLMSEFDPETMECVEVVEGEDQKVIEVIEPGYFLKNKLIRVAKVKVGKKGGTYG